MRALEPTEVSWQSTVQVVWQLGAWEPACPVGHGILLGLPVGDPLPGLSNIWWDRGSLHKEQEWNGFRCIGSELRFDCT